MRRAATRAAGSHGIAKARQHLRTDQAAWASTPPLADAIERTHARAHDDERAMDLQATGSPGGSRDDVAARRDRWRRTHAILDRIRPGPYEDPEYLAVLAYEAAAIELSLGRLAPAIDTTVSRVILGTVGAPWPDAVTVPRADVVVIEVAAGLLRLVHESARAVTTWPSSGDDLGAALEHWLYDGGCGPWRSDASPPLDPAASALLVREAERFILGHEYCHAVGTVDAMHPGWDAELRADAFAARVVIDSFAWVERVPAVEALRGALLSMRAQDMLSSALGIARHGWAPGTVDTPTHPAWSRRARAMEQLVAARPGALTDNERCQLWEPADRLGMVWQQVAPFFAAQYAAGRPVHPLLAGFG